MLAFRYHGCTLHLKLTFLLELRAPEIMAGSRKTWPPEDKQREIPWYSLKKNGGWGKMIKGPGYQFDRNKDALYEATSLSIDSIC